MDFERHIMGLFGRLGCNSGSCHGSFQGKGGFRLSLFGYDPEKDYYALTREVLGRRINPVDPDNSLILLKATGQVEHGGGRRIGKDSWQYQVFKEWIRAGAPWKKGSGAVAVIRMTPTEHAFRKPGDKGQLTIKATFADGTEEDITPFCDFRVQDDAVAEVSQLGLVSARQAGDTAVIVSYRGNILPARVLVPFDAPPGFKYPKVPEVNYIDREVFAKLRRLNIVPSELSSDAEFLRRVTIDTIGALPKPDEVRAFLADTDPNKRAKKIEELLQHPLHAAIWATKFCDITGNNTDQLENPQNLRPRRSQMWYDWLRKRFADNVPYDEIVRGILCATSRDGLSPEEWIQQVNAMDQAMEKGFETPYPEKKSLDLFWRRQNNVPIEMWGEKVAAAFMGVRIECAQCHKHPFDRWTQVDYRSFANVFAQVSVGVSPEARKVIDGENAARRSRQSGGRNNNRQLISVREVFIGPSRRTFNHPETNASLPAKALGGPEIPLKDGQDAREQLFDWLRSPDNPFFARSFVNRVWAHYFGKGIVDPVDDFSLGNPPSNEKLLDALARDFIEHKFDIRRLERTILNSRTYQLSSDVNETNRFDKNNYSHAYVRRMMAEVVVDVLNDALGVTEDFGSDAPPGARAIEVGASRPQNNSLAYVFRLFGRPPRTTACDCERAMEPALPQTLFLMTDQTLLSKLERSRLRNLLNANKTDDEILEELFLATLSRYPTESDKQLVAAYRAKKSDRRAVFTDILWALINTREFILNH
ncbi:MAG: PSD1 and planctomycete cytochrome C domain-containing protein [Gemmataceae bacterium]|nr:PSD1 and planctomycete cytochrome C domain-containing protein [Gemmataceae bacterium]MDW8266610.1 DUF1553 domain-containing protein [Gemmataceae bacterium]